MKKKETVAGIVIAFATMISHAHTVDTQSADATASFSAKVKCLGVNECKGQSACKTPTSDCMGKNHCKSNGWILTTKTDCQNKGGKIEKLT